MEESKIIKAHEHSSNHHDEIMSSNLCGCFYCLRFFPPEKITDWTLNKNQEPDAAICPYCGIDAVIGSQSGFPITREFLKEMEEYWFDELDE